jgi:hypothetical protein
VVAVKENLSARVVVQVNIPRAWIAYKASVFIFLPSSFRSRPQSLCNLALSDYYLLFCHLSPSLSPHIPTDYIHSAMPPRTGSQWDHKSDKDLLLAIIDSGALKGIDWKVISEKMTAKGYTFTHEACRYVNSFEPFFFTSLPFVSSISAFLCAASSYAIAHMCLTLMFN